SPAYSCASAAARAVARRRDVHNRQVRTRRTPAPPVTADVRLECTGPVATVTLSRPDVLNAQTPAMWRAMREVSRDLPAEVRVVVVRGEGRSFSAGLDRSVATGTGADTFSEMLTLSPEACAERIAGFQAGFTWLHRPDIISVAAVQGHAIGAGFQLALAC